MKYIKWLIYVLILINLMGCQDEPVTTVTGYSAEEPLIITMYSEDLKSEDNGFSSPVANEITRLTGVKLDVQYPVEAVSDKMDLMINSGDYPDLILVKDTQRIVDAGDYVDLKPLIDEHGPNLMKLYGKYIERLKFNEEDPSIYVFPAHGVDEVLYEPDMGFKLQHAVVKALDYPELKTLEDYEKAIKDYIEMYPTIDGEETIGLTFVIEDWRWKITLGNSGGFATGAPDDGNWYVDPVTYEAKYRFLREEEREYYRWLNHMYNEGLVDPDSFVQDLDAYYAKIASGRVLGLIDATWQVNYPEQILRSQGKVDRMYGSYPIQVDETTISADFRDKGYIGGYGIGISKNCKDPVAAIKFLDFMASDEGQILRMWGIENKHYYYDEAGKRQIYDEEKQKKFSDVNYTSQTGIGIYEYPFPRWGIGKKDSFGNEYDPSGKDYEIESFTAIEKEVLKAYDAEIWADLYPTKEELPISKWGEAWDLPIPSDSPIRYQLEACDGIMKAGIVKSMLVSPDEFDDTWDTIMNDLEVAGVHQMGLEFTKLVKNRIEFWSE